MTSRIFDDRVGTARRRLDELGRRAADVEGPVRELVAEALEELSVALEELHVVGEDLAVQNDALVAAHAEVEAERRRYRELFDFAPDGYVVTDTRGVLRDVGATAAVLVRTTPELLVGKPFAALVPESRRREFRTFLSQLTKGGTTEHETRIRRNGETTFPASLRVSYTLDPDGRVEGLRWLVRDMSEREHAEALRAREAWYRRIESASPVGMYVTDEQGTCVFSTGPVDAIYDRSTAGLSSEDRIAAVHPDERPAARRWWDGLLRGEVPPPLRCRLVRSDGSSLWVENAAAPLRDPAGGIEGVVVNVHDVTAEVAAREHLAGVERMEMVGRLAGGLAHDFNNLLHIILGSCELALDKLAPGDPLSASLEGVERAAERGALLTGQLLTMSRQRVSDPVPLDLNRVVRADEATLSGAVGEQIDLEVRLDPGLPFVVADPIELEQVLLNLVFNACDAMPDGGRLAIATTLVDMRAAGLPEGLARGLYVALEVRDTGCGMDDAIRARLFEPFFTTKRESGTGLGLSTAYGAVRSWQGTIAVESIPGEGSTFRVLLPASDSKPFPSVDDVALPPELPRGTETVLLAEDEAEVRVLARQVLEDRGYHVLEARGSGEALELARAHDGDVDVLVTDVVMPGMNGLALARRLKADRPGVRVLYISGYAELPPLSAELREARSAFLAKPFRARGLAVAVRRLLDSVPAAP